MQFFKHPLIALTLLGWHVLLGALGHGLHYATSGGERPVPAALGGCGCGSNAGLAERCLSLPAPEARGHWDAPVAATVDTAHASHDAQHCVICQWLAQSKQLSVSGGVLWQAEPVVLRLPILSSVVFASCPCPYVSRAPPVASPLA